MSSSDREAAVRRPVTALPFRLHASVNCPPPAELAMSVAWELGELDGDGVERGLTALGTAIHPELETDAETQLRALGEAVTNAALAARHDGGPRELLIDEALARGHAHPVLVAIILQEVGRRAGLPIGIVAGAHGHFLAHQRLTEPLVLDPATGRLTDPGALGTMRWQCGHQLAATLLDLLEPRYERAGDLTRETQVARLRTTLPFDDMSDAEQRLNRVTARQN